MSLTVELLRKPTDSGVLDLLAFKINQYASRLNPSAPPEQQLDTVYKKAIATQVLVQGVVSKEEMRKQMLKKYGEGCFDEEAFENAWAVIRDYCLTGGANCIKQ